VSVSVIIPFFRSEGTISRAVNSVLLQTFKPSEIIIVNDNSESGDLNVFVSSYSSSIELIKIDLGENFGAAAARNAGVLRARGDYLAFLDADDVWHPRKIELQMREMLLHGSEFSCHDYVENINNKKLDESVSGVSAITGKSFVFGNPIFTPTVIISRKDFILFDEKLRRSEDLRCWLSNMNRISCIHISAQLAGGFKAAVGASGLSASLRLMHMDYIKAWGLIYNNKEISFVLYFAIVSLERLKYPLRLVNVFFKRMLNWM
jgi:glycosyltransferase involved in cell wall biosynthesis